MSNKCYHYFSVKLLSLGLDASRKGIIYIYINVKYMKVIYKCMNMHFD